LVMVRIRMRGGGLLLGKSELGIVLLGRDRRGEVRVFKSVLSRYAFRRIKLEELFQ